MRTDDSVLFPESDFPEKLSDTTSAKDSPDLELFVTPAAYKVSCLYPRQRKMMILKLGILILIGPWKMVL